MKYIILTSDTLELVQYGVIFLINLTVKRLDCELMPSLRENDLESASSIICFVRIATKILNTQRKLLPCISYFSFSLRSASVTLLKWEEICLAQLSVLVNLLSLYRVYVYRDDVFLLSSIFLLPLTMSIHTLHNVLLTVLMVLMVTRSICFTIRSLNWWSFPLFLWP